MKSIYLILILLIGVKIYSFSLLKDKTTENTLASNFVEYDLYEGRLDNLIRNQEAIIFDITRPYKNWNITFKKLTNEIKDQKLKNFSVYLEIFNSSELRALLEYPKITYTENLGLSSKHNCSLVIKTGYNHILNSISKKLNVYEERPYLMSLERKKDSISFYLVNAIHGDFDAQMVYQGDTTKVNSLPVNIGPIEGVVTFLITDPNTKHIKWYRKKY